MPNDCWSHVTFTAKKEELDAFLENEFKDVPDWALKIKARGQGGVVLNLWSRWVPDFAWFERMLDTYPSAWIKNEWSEEGGGEGVWIGTKRDGVEHIQHMEWQGMCLEEEAERFKTGEQ